MQKIMQERKVKDAGCCEIDCIYAVTGVLRDGEVVKEAVVELYENFLLKKGGGRFDQWMEIVVKSVGVCAAAGKFRNLISSL
jgi:hypothetical protein